jgi:colicin import membrane protein
MKSNKKAAEDQKSRQLLRELRLQKVAVEKAAKEETEAAVRAEVEAQAKRVAAEKKAKRDAQAAEQRRLSQEGTDRVRAARLAAPPTTETAEAVAQRARESAEKKAAEKAEKSRKHQARQEEAGSRKKPKTTRKAYGT